MPGIFTETERLARLIHWPDIDAAALIGYGKFGAHVVNFKCYRGMSTDFKGGNLEFRCADGDSYTSDIVLADAYCHGGVKWDGCSDVYFDDQDRAMLHFCGRRGISDVVEMLQRVYDEATRRMGAAHAYKYLPLRDVQYEAAILRADEDLVKLLDRETNDET